MDTQPSWPKLKSLAPVYDARHHALYHAALATALDDASDARNIALTGAYGTGKSSILRSLEDSYGDRLLMLSLSTVGRGVGEADSTSTHEPSAATTNRIQQEIVKQILYRDEPARTRGSRFRRIARFRPRRELTFAAVIGTIASASAFLAGWTGPLSAQFTEWWWVVAAEHLLLLALVAVCVMGFRWWANDRLVLEKLTAGPATVSMSTQSSTSYFDQYMDEIVYYFEVSGRDIVVFEDIDRFDNIHIFEALRALNTLLNNSEQVQRRRGHRGLRRKRAEKHSPPVRFIYALRDSIFEKIEGEDRAADAAQEEIRRANRTKFFDLVIPVVPFVTHRNARDIMSEVFADTRVTDSLINLTAGHVADKRLMINLRNEFDIYSNRLLDTPSPVPGLNADKLLALLLYKSVHLADFEAIRTGTSKLDELHNIWRLLVTQSLGRSREELRTATLRMQRSGSAQARARELGSHLEGVLLAVMGPNAPHRPPAVRIDSQDHYGPGLQEVDFWKSLTRPGANLIIHTPGYNNGRAHSLKDLEVLMGTTLDQERWTAVDLQAQQRLAEAARADQHFLQHHSWRQIHGRSTFFVQSADHGQESFSSVVERLIGSRLGRDLIAHGFIDDYFALYISMYYGHHLKPAALNFIVHALDRGRPDHSYSLEPDDVEAVLREQGDVVITDRSAYNTSILDHLLASDDRRAHTVIGLLSAWTRPDRTFAEEYVTAGAHKRTFIELLAPLVDHILIFTVENTAISEEDRPDLVDAALSRLSSELAYAPSPSLGAFVTRFYQDFPSLVRATDVEATQNVVRALAGAGISVPDVEPLNTVSRRQLAASKNYVLTERNLQLLSGSTCIALDVLQAHDESLHQRALEDLRTYLDAVAMSLEKQVSVADSEKFDDQVSAVIAASEESADLLADLIKLAGAECRVPELKDAPQEAWAPLCAYRRTLPSASNVLAYLDKFEAIDENIALLLDERQEFEDVNLQDDDRQRLAVGLLNARGALPSVQHRIRLAASLKPGLLATHALIGEPGPLAGELVAAKLLLDDEIFFSSHLLPDWPSREHAIRNSFRFVQFCTPTTLPKKDVASLFDSTAVTTEIKTKVFESLREFVENADPASHSAAARFALDMHRAITKYELQVLAYGAADAQLVMELLESARHLKIDEVLEVLRAMGDPYRSIADGDVEEVTVPHSPSGRAVIDRLKRAKCIAAYRSKGGQIRVHPR